MVRPIAAGLLLASCALLAPAQENRAAAEAAQVVDHGLQRTEREVRNILEEELGLARKALREREAAFAARRDDLLRSFAAFPRANLQRHDTRHPVFHGCCDWHSAVHAHWALLRVMRATGDRGDVELMRQSLTAQGLAREMAYLKRHPDFEMPYGRAWFLRMAIDDELLLGEGPVRQAADQVAESLDVYFRTLRRSPWKEDYASDSWGLAQLHAWYRHAKNDERRAEVERWAREDFLQSRARLSAAEDLTRAGFFSRWGNWAYLLCETTSTDDLRAWYASHSLAHPDPVLSPASPHHLGMDWSRAWAMGALAKALHDASLRWAYLDHIDAGLAQKERYAGEYLVYDHWVPQFAIYALTADLDDK